MSDKTFRLAHPCPRYPLPVCHSLQAHTLPAVEAGCQLGYPSVRRVDAPHIGAEWRDWGPGGQRLRAHDRSVSAQSPVRSRYSGHVEFRLQRVLPGDSCRGRLARRPRPPCLHGWGRVAPIANGPCPSRYRVHRPFGVRTGPGWKKSSGIITPSFLKTMPFFMTN
jgi:hypothetical protein